MGERVITGVEGQFSSLHRGQPDLLPKILDIAVPFWSPKISKKIFRKEMPNLHRHLILSIQGESLSKVQIQNHLLFRLTD
jgi:hypothetical protein